MKEFCIFEGSSVTCHRDFSPAYLFTAHVGGEFDASRISPGGFFRVCWSKAEEGYDLALVSHSGGPRWRRLSPEQICSSENGFYADFGYDVCVSAYGSDFSRLDDLRLVARSDRETVLTRFSFFASESDPVPLPYAPWLVPEEGIVFVGDSITQNVLYNEGDFNTLLHRADCVNFGIGAQTSRHILRRIGDPAGRHFRQAVIWCGINDLFHQYSARETCENIFSMCDTFRAGTPGIRFVLISILPTTASWYKNEQPLIRQRNDLLRDYAAFHGDTAFADVYPLFLADSGYARDDLLLDGLHPNHQGYELVRSVLEPLLLPQGPEL